MCVGHFPAIQGVHPLRLEHAFLSTPNLISTLPLRQENIEQEKYHVLDVVTYRGR